MRERLRAIIVGEVLYDLFEDGQAVLGGAPFNVAWHLHGFGQSPLLISRVGQDDYGVQIRQTMQEWGMDLTGLQVDSGHPTGLVRVSLADGQPRFEICDDAAYDHIDLAQADQALVDVDAPLLYYGSLAARHPQVFDVIQQLRQGAHYSFIDINLRPPWWQRPRLDKLMHGANYLKVNDDELQVLTSVEKTPRAMIEAARQLLEDYQLDTVIVTRGEQGALVITATQTLEPVPVKARQIQDTVGAGDAFSAVAILGILQGWEAASTFARASEFAARICEQRGASKADARLYDDYRQRWQV